MHLHAILCIICSDIVNQAEIIYVTKCGHLFHHHCLSQWIERSRTCPQCRCEVTDRCMWRVYPTAAGGAGEDAGALQARLDDALLQLRQLTSRLQEADGRLQTATAATDAALAQTRAGERRLLSVEAAAAALREQVAYLKQQNKETQRLQEENDAMQNKLNTLTDLGKVLSGTADDVEAMLQAGSDVRTIATFATALKRALCEAERGKREAREARQRLRSQLATERERADTLQMELTQQTALAESLQAERDGWGGGRKRRRSSLSPPPAPAPVTPPSPVRDASNEGRPTAEQRPASPYLALRAGAGAGAAGWTLKPTEVALLSGVARPYSIFPAPRAGHGGGEPRGGHFDGLRGRARHSPSPCPVPRAPLPRPGARHRLRRPASPAAAAPSIAHWFQKLRDK